MEKLQQALENARRKRETGTGPAEAPAKPRTPLPGGRQDRSGTAAAWDRLPYMQTDQDRMEKSRLFSNLATTASTPFDVLRTKALLEMRRHGWKRVAITSPTASCGKTTIACNFAAGLGRQKELRTILFDLDLRRPATSKIFGYRPTNDITEVLEGETAFEDQALRLTSNVAVSMAAKSSSDPTRFLMRDQTNDILDDIQKRYQPDVMIFDLPPLLMGDDTRAFLKHVDCAIIVARAEVTTASQIDICEREIAEHTGVLGVVLNQYKFQDESYGYAYEGTN